MRTDFTDVLGYKVRYAEHGIGSPLLLVHGLGGSIESWVRNIDELSRHFRVLVPDLIGFGQSEKPDLVYSMKLFVRFLGAFMDRMGVRSASVIGSSMGGQIAAEMAMAKLGRVEKLVLISPAGTPPKTFRGTRELRQYMRLFDAKSIEDLRRSLAPLDAKPSLSDEYLRSVYEYRMMQGAKHAFMSALKGSSVAPRLFPRIISLGISTLVIWGRQDSLIPVKYCEPFVTGMENCRVIVLEGCGHRAHFERPEIFNRLVIDFLKE